MNVLVYDVSPRIKTALVKLFLQNAFKVRATDDKNEVLPRLKVETHQILIMDFAAEDPDHLKVIQQVRKDEATRGVKIFLHSRTSNRDVIMPAIKAGIHGIILKPFDHSKFMKYFYELVKKNNFNIDRREHIRIIPKKEHNAKIILRSRVSSRTLVGDIVNISFGGVAFKPFGGDWTNEIKEKDLLPDVLITIDDRRIRSNAIVAAVREKLVALILIGMSIECEDDVSAYIYKNILYELRGAKIPVSADDEASAEEAAEAISEEIPEPEDKGPEGITLDKFGFPQK